ncbi:MAG: hypothetical protein H8E84_05240 [Flavobacteriales bacterium]|nr:hypothetical protein [Flavobacteriales bacterium]
MKNLKNNIEQTCTDFGEYLINNANKGIDNIDVMWEQFQKEQAKEVMDILDDITDKTDISDTIDNFEKRYVVRVSEKTSDKEFEKYIKDLTDFFEPHKVIVLRDKNITIKEI